ELKSDPALDIVCGYLDDFCVAGDSAATLRALLLIQERAASLGLELNLEKCEVIPTAGRNTQCDLSVFPAGVQRKADGCFKLLGAPIGGHEHCAELVQVKRVQKLTTMLDEVPLLEDAQVAHKLLSRCFGACRLMHNMRTTRPDWITRGLEQCQQALRSTFQICTGTALTDSQWQQASLPLSKGGLGSRCGTSHAAAAYLASRMATRHLRGQIDAAFSWDGDCEGGALAAAVNLYNAGARHDHHLTGEDLTSDGSFPGQRALSMKVDEKLLDQLIAASPDAHKARLLATSAPHASAWLQAQPCSALGQRMSHYEFVAALRLWLGCPASSRDDWCPKCDQVMDAQSLHSLCCMAGGDASRCTTLCVTRQSAVQGAAARQLSAATSYEAAELADSDTVLRCEQLGIRLVPMVAESFGGWGAMAQDVFRSLIHARAARSGET
ncbi:unnamed protein product, partial [Prorocentrum cordatum]